MSEFEVLRTPNYSEFIHKSRYARWIDSENRRETWPETVDRLMDFWRNRFSIDQVSNEVIEELRQAILTFKIMPSMRSLMTAGKALERDNVAGFNCAMIAVDSPRAFDEALYILACGTGLGFSVERQYITRMPEVAEEFHETDTTIHVRDSKIGWATSFRELISLLYVGKIPSWNLSKIRPKGAKLKTFGGRASGPDPLDDLFRFTISIFKRAIGRKLTSLECHDLMCKVAEVIVVGGVRRSALLSLSNLSDQRMRNAKSGQWWEDNPQRALSNNAVNYTEKPDIGIFMDEWKSLYDSKSGERSIINEVALKRLMPQRRKDLNYEGGFGVNPCAEISLRASGQFCNLTTIIVRPEDWLDSLKEKIRLATILGTMQATITDFRYLRKIWKKNTEEEALLGVSMTGIMDHAVLNGTAFLEDGEKTLSEWLVELKEMAASTNLEYSKKLGINQASAVTCVKPEGTCSQLTDTASGIHPRYSKYYIRTVRQDIKDPLTSLMISLGVPNEPCHLKPGSTVIFSFPIESPDSSIYRDDRTALEQLEIWKLYQVFYCEHKPSITIYVKEDEWLQVAAWVYSNFDILSGVSFLPHSDHSYKQAPYQEITKEEYLSLLETSVTIDWLSLKDFELEDSTTNTKELACSGGSCEII